MTGSVTLWMITVAQLEMFTSAGPTRSFICAVPELPELRLTPNARPKDRHDVAVTGNTSASVRSMIASPNSCD